MSPSLPFFATDLAELQTIASKLGWTTVELVQLDIIFLVFGKQRSTRDSEGQWYKDGRPIDFDYQERKVVASGKTATELMNSAREYLRLSGMTMMQYIDELCSKSEPA